MRRTTATLAAAVATLGAAMALAACTAGGTPDALATSDAPATSQSSAVTAVPTSPPTSAPSATPSGETSARPSGPTSGTATTTARVAPRWPRALGEPQQGDPVWAVYLAVGHSASDPVVEQGLRDAARVGYQAVVGDIACDGGAMDALGLDQYDYWSGASLYFRTESDARAFAAAFTIKVRAPKAVAKVNVGCLD